MKPTVNNSVFQTKITPIKPLNEEFTLAQCRVMALGKNRNFYAFLRVFSLVKAFALFYSFFINADILSNASLSCATPVA